MTSGAGLRPTGAGGATGAVDGSGAPVVRATSASPLTLDDPSATWVVESGEVDVFLRTSDPAQGSGARSHLFRVGTGEALFGLDLRAHDGLQVVAVGLADTTVRAVDPDRHADGAALVDGWVGHLSEVLVTDGRPRETVALGPGENIVPGVGTTLQATSGVVWLSVGKDEVLLAGDPDLHLPATGDPFPLSAPAWVVATGDGLVSGTSTAAVLGDRGSRQALGAFHALLLSGLVRQGRRGEAERRDRLRRHIQTDRQIGLGAARRLASVLGNERRIDYGSEIAEDPLLAASQLVGNALGIKIQGPEHRTDGGSRPLLEEISRSSRVRMRRVALKGDWWRRDGGPLLGFRGSQPVALLPKNPRTYVLVDPSQEGETRVTDDVARQLEPFGQVFYPPLPERAVDVKDLLRFILRGNARDLVWVLLMGVAGGLLGMVVPIATKQVVETAIPQAEVGSLLVLALGMTAAAVSGMGFEIVRSFAVLRVETRVDTTFQAAVWDRLLSLPAPFFRRYSSGDLAVRALGINSIRQLITGATVSTLLSGLFSVFSFVLIFSYSATLGAIAALMAVVVVAVTLAGSYLQLRYQRQTTEVLGSITSLVLQLVGGVAKLRVAGAETRAYAVWADRFSTQKALSSKAQSAANRLTVFNASSGILTSLVIFGVVGLTSRADLSTGEFVAFNTAFAQFLFASTGVTAAFTSILQATPYYERAKPILQTPPEVDRGKVDPGELAGSLELRGVSFRYDPDGPIVLDQVSLEVGPGEFVAVVGRSGAGKSSLIRLLLGFETPEAGSTYYDSHDLAGLDLTAVRRQMGVVLQNGRLMSGNIFSNIVGSADLTMDDAWDAARRSGLDTDISAMPMGMYTFLSDGATTISGGQRQRLMIARAIVGRPRILIFDEATSALDNRTQALVSESLEKLKVTRIVIAHRLSTILNADRIYVLDQGRVAQSGTYAELMAVPGLFRDMASRQIA